MADLKPAYLIHGDDHGAVAERRAGLRALAEGDRGGGTSVEHFEGDAGAPAAVAAALAAMTLGMGQRVMIVDGVERWREADVKEHLVASMRHMPPDTTLALFAREEARAKAPAAAHAAVKGAGGQIVAQMTVKSWELAKWVRAQAPRLGLQLDNAAAKALIAQVGERQQRLLRELEKLALEGQQDDERVTAIDAEAIEARAAHSMQWRAYSLADALVGADASEATRTYLRLREQGERLPGLMYLMASRLREALTIALRLQTGESVAEVKRSLRMPARAAERFVADVQRSDPDRLRAALATLADLELDSRGGAPLLSSRTAAAALHEDTIAVRAITTIAA